jgi:PAS domain S-box-containing protein
MAAGLVALVGWITDVQRLTDWPNDGISMFPNTAMCAIASGLALLLHSSGPRRRAAARVLALLVASVGGLTLVEHVTSLDLGIDRLVFAERPWGQAAAAAPMRMGPPASVAFLMIGAALTLLGGGARARRASAALGIAVAAVAMLSLSGRLYGAQQMYTLPRLTGIALPTASVVVMLGIGLIASVREREPMRAILEQSAAGMLARRALPIVILIPLALGWARVVLQQQGIVDLAFGTALRTIVEVALLTGLLWWAVVMVRSREHALHESQAELRRKAGQLATFLDTAAVGLSRVGPDGVVLWANDTELAMLGYAREEYVGHDVAEFHADAVALADILARLHRGENVVDYETRMTARDGSVKRILVDASVLWDDGRFVHSQWFTRDVTDRRRIEAEREEANRRKDEFLAILAHELRNPLAPVRNAAQVLKVKAAAIPDLQRPIEMIERQVAQMSRLIDDLLDVSRISRGALGVRRTRVLCSEIVDAAVDACHDELEAKGHSLRTRVPAEPVVLLADRERLVQVLCNLLGNAAKYTPAGGRIAIEVEVARDVLELSVRDDGIGIPPDRLTEIFELFARVDPSFERQGGLGIGLTLVRQLVELHGGTIEARSAGVGHGSEFVVSLPVVAATATTAAASADDAPACTPRRILVADDNRDAVESLKLLLELSGHDVHTAFDGEAAITCAERLLPEVALLDIGMPKANGYEVARRIREHPWGKGIYLIALTGWGQDDDKRRAREAGFDAHLVKPVPPNALDRLLATMSDPPAPPVGS